MKYGILGLVIVAIGAGGLFYYYHTDKAEHDAVIRTIVEIRDDIVKTVARLDAEQAKLDSLNFRLNFGGIPNKDIRDQYLRTQLIISNKTDIFFLNATSSHPELAVKVKNKATKEALDRQRAEINEALALWNEHIDSATSVELRADLIVESNRNMSIITAYIHDLGKVASTLTTQNSGLSSAVIATYVATIAEATKEVAQVQTILLAVVVTPPTPTNSGNPNSGPTQEELAVLAQIEAQKAIVAAETARALALQAELAHAEAVATAQAQAQANAQAQAQVQAQQEHPKYVQPQSGGPAYVPGDPVTDHVTIPDTFHPDEPQLIQGW